MISDTIVKIWCGSEVVEFGSAYSVEVSVERLRAATRRSLFSAMFRQEAVGTVRRDLVSLQRVMPLMGNAFKPFFRGRFEERDGKVFLRGRFGMHWLVKVFLSSWFGFILLMSLLCISGIVSGEKGPLDTLLGASVMCFFGMLLVAFGRWLARNDKAWLSGVIRTALSAQPD